MVSVREALDLIADHVTPLPVETVSIDKAMGRVLAKAVVSDIDSPPHDKSVMDGFAVVASDLDRGVRTLRVVETVLAGQVPSQTVSPGTAARIMTGAPMPEGADAVVMIERTNVGYRDPTPDSVTIDPDFHLTAGKHVMHRAGNFSNGQTIMAAGRVIRPVDIGLLAECGADKLWVYVTPSVAVLATGDELVDVCKFPGPSQIRNSNGPMLSALMRNLNCHVETLGVATDDRADLDARVRSGVACDVMLLTGGVSAGVADLVPESLTNAGVETVFHKVQMKPGKPVLFGVRKRNDGTRSLVFGLPGNPVSSLVGVRLFVRTAIARLTGMVNPEPKPVRAMLSKDHQTRGNRPTYWPGRLVEGGEADDSNCRIVEPLPWNGSSDLLSLRDCGGLIHFPVRNGESYQAGESVDFIALD